MMSYATAWTALGISLGAGVGAAEPCGPGLAATDGLGVVFGAGASGWSGVLGRVTGTAGGRASCEEVGSRKGGGTLGWRARNSSQDTDRSRGEPRNAAVSRVGT